MSSYERCLYIGAKAKACCECLGTLDSNFESGHVTLLAIVSRELVTETTCTCTSAKYSDTQSVLEHGVKMTARDSNSRPSG